MCACMFVGTWHSQMTAWLNKRMNLWTVDGTCEPMVCCWLPKFCTETKDHHINVLWISQLCRLLYEKWRRQVGVASREFSSGIASFKTCPSPFTPFARLAAVLRLQRNPPSFSCGSHFELPHDAVLHYHNMFTKGWWVFIIFLLLFAIWRQNKMRQDKIKCYCQIIIIILFL